MSTRSLNHRSIRARRGLACAVAAIVAISAGPVVRGSASEKLPFYAGEELTYRMRVGGLGTVGTGTMTVTSTSIRGVPALLLASEFSGRLALVSGRDRTRSWVEPGTLRVLRYEKSERTPFSRREESVDVYPAERRWVDADGRSGRTPTTAPLDELSFIYFIRTLPLLPGDYYKLDRHFEEGRNPVVIRVLGRERIEVGAGTFDAVVVEMRVRDPARHKGEAVIKIHLTDDDCRIPLRIQSDVPTLGRTEFTLEAHSHPETHVATR